MNPESQVGNPLFTKVFFALTGAWSDVHTFRRLVNIGQTDAWREVVSTSRSSSDELLNNPAYENVLLDKVKFIESRGGRDGIAKQLADQTWRGFLGSVDAASLVFMHSGLDAAAHDLCRVSAQVAPERWSPFLDNQEERLAVIRVKGFETIVAERLGAFLEALSRESLLKKIDRLFQVCQPDRGYVRKGYKFDKPRLVRIDRLRHDVVHGDVRHAPIPEIEAEIEFLSETGLYLFSMVNHQFGVKIDPLYMPVR